MSAENIARAEKIRLLLCDVDGVLTNGHITIDALSQSESLTFHVHDGLGLQLLKKYGIDVGIVTSRQSAAVSLRMKNLNIAHVHLGCKDKLKKANELREQLQLSWSQIAFVGDDLVDIAVMQQSGFAITVANATSCMGQYAHWQTSLAGGEGAVREICEFILRAQKHSFDMDYCLTR